MYTKTVRKPNKNKRISPSETAFIGAIITLIGGFFISYNYIEGIGKYTIFNIFCVTQKQSIAVKEILKAYNAKYFVSESKTL